VVFALASVILAGGNHLLDSAKSRATINETQPSYSATQVDDSYTEPATTPANQATEQPVARSEPVDAQRVSYETQTPDEQARSARIREFEQEYPELAINPEDYRDKLTTCFDYFASTGRFTTAQICGIVGNAMQESHLDPHADNGFAYGTWQHEDTRRAELEAWPNYDTLEGQMSFVMHEFDTTERYAYNALLEATTPDQAAIVFCKTYERAGDPRERTRSYYADKIYQWYSEQEMSSAT